MAKDFSGRARAARSSSCICRRALYFDSFYIGVGYTTVVTYMIGITSFYQSRPNDQSREIPIL
jgi:hypothetical protein